jgi:hypothetical protein
MRASSLGIRRMAMRAAAAAFTVAPCGATCCAPAPAAAAALAACQTTGLVAQRRFQATRPGDWTCGGCGFANFGSRVVCKNCAAPRPGAAAAATQAHSSTAEWNCPSCQLSNPSDVAYCVACSFARPAAAAVAAAPAGGMQAGGGSSSEPKPGDWLCNKCAFHNFRRNATCRQCGNAKPDAPVMPAGGSPNFTRPAAPAQPTAPGGPTTFMKGDWTCTGCGDHNFAKRDSCRACGLKRPKLTNPDLAKADWPCPSCAVSNFGRRTECFKCGAAKPAAAAASESSE